jgi:hypothetical protein
MGMAKWSSGLLAAALGSAAIGQPTAERLAAPPLPQFVVGYSAGNAEQSIKEEIPRGETVQAWSRMVTTQRFTGLAARATPAQYANNILAAIPQKCPTARISPVANLTVSGRSAIRFEVDCPAATRRQREMFILLAIAGRSDMHVKQVAFRGNATPQNVAWGRGFLAATVLCQPGVRQAACR